MSRQPERDREVLPDREAAELLARASEMDARRAAGSEVEDLRAAAAEAGISASSFDTALAQMRVERSVLPVMPAPRNSAVRKWFFAVALTMAVAGGMLLLRTAAPPPSSSAPADAIVEERIPVRCISATQAAELIRPILTLASNRIIVSPAGNTLTVNATRLQLEQVKAQLAQQEQTAQGCAK